MGIHDREYYRDDQTAGVSLGQQSMVTKIIIVTVVIYLINAFLPSIDLMHEMASSAGDLFKPWLWWRFLTSGFAHAPGTINHILFNMAGLFFLGRTVETKLGQSEFLRFYLVAIVLGSVAQALRAYLMDPGADGWTGCYGASGAVSAVVILFICYYPKATLLVFFVIPAPAWVVGVFYIAISVLGANGIGDPHIAHDVHLVGVAFGFAYYCFRWNLGRFMPGSGAMKALKRKPKLRVHDPDSDHQGRDSEADALLEKVNREGMNSLTAREQKILEEYSRRMRQKHR
jgi:membrane associated rhomboid family serine protease